MGKEYNTVERAEKKKKVVVVGGGPSGMEAARVSALRGHDVTLYEEGKKLGGLLPVAAVVKGTELEDLPAMISYLERQINKLGVKINLETKVDAAISNAMGFGGHNATVVIKRYK